jgi:hypothetical protein
MTNAPQGTGQDHWGRVAAIRSAIRTLVEGSFVNSDVKDEDRASYLLSGAVDGINACIGQDYHPPLNQNESNVVKSYINAQYGGCCRV